MMHENGHGSQNSDGTAFQEQINTWAVQNTAVSLSSLSLQGQGSNVSDGYDHKPVLGIMSWIAGDLLLIVLQNSSLMNA